MNKLLDFGRKALFAIRVITGYEERRIRAYRMQLHERIAQAQARKVTLKNIPEQMILSELRRVVDEMQTLNRSLEETEAKIDEFFKPIDNNAETIMNLQFEKEERNMKEMAKAMHEQVLLQRDAEERAGKLNGLDPKYLPQNATSTPTDQQSATGQQSAASAK